MAVFTISLNRKIKERATTVAKNQGKTFSSMVEDLLVGMLLGEADGEN